MLRRFTVSISLALVAVLLFSGLALAAWEYYFPINVVDTSNTTRTFYPVMLGFNGQTLVDAEKISSNGTDTNMQIGSSNITYMLSTTNVTAVIPNLTAGGVVEADLYTGYSPEQSGFPIITGSGGYVTVSDNDTMECGDNFTWQFVGYVDTDNGANKYVLYKYESLYIYVSPTESGTVILAVEGGGSSSWLSPTSQSSDWTGGANVYDGNTGTLGSKSTAVGQWSSFITTTLPSTVRSTKVRFWAGNYGGGSINLDIDVYDVDTTSWVNVYSGAFADLSWVEKTFTERYVSQVRVRMYNGTISDPLNMNLYEVQAEEILPLTVSVAGKTSSEYTIIGSANTTHLALSVGATENSTALGVASVDNNTYNWLFGQNNVMPYTDNITLDVDGVPQLWLAPTVMLIGTNIPDRSLNSHNGTIIWGSNSGVSITYGEMTSYESYVATANVTGGFDMPTASMPSTWFAAGENATALPFYDSFSAVSAQTGRPVQSYYFIAIIGVAFGAFIGIVSFTRSALMAYVAMTGVFGIGASMTIIPAWIVFVLIIIGVGIMFLYRQVAY